jgi:DNA-binding NarL/FixJ family response regulator
VSEYLTRGEIQGRALSPREVQIARLVALGMTNKSIARTLEVEEGTIKAHISNSLRKLGIHSRTQLALMTLGVKCTPEESPCC